jgi:glycosyltransferase involved in cell wall biosynthesis
MTEVVFAPDWRQGVPYQRLLAEALGGCDVRVSFLRDYRRLLPLTRLMRAWQQEHRCDVLHLHWPEAYYDRRGDRWDAFRRARFSTDLALATRRCGLVVTAHNLHAHNRGGEPFAQHNTRAAFRRAGAVIAHSAAARAVIVERFGIAEEKIRVIPHGDLSVTLPPPLPREKARAELQLSAGPVCLMYGAIEPYKGLEEIIAFWKRERPAATLAIAGKPFTEEYGSAVRKAAVDVPNVDLRFGWLSDEQLAVWLSASDAVLFNYRQIFTSGAASLARSFGVPILLPERLSTVDLAEPHPLVMRFRSPTEDLAVRLSGVLAVAPSYEQAQEWRAQTSWSRVAAQTAAAYQSALR